MIVAVKSGDGKFYLSLAPRPITWIVADIWKYPPPPLFRIREVTERQAAAHNRRLEQGAH